MDQKVRIWRRPEVLERLCVSSATLWRMTKDGRFPKPITLGSKSVGWVVSEVEDWLEEKMPDR